MRKNPVEILLSECPRSSESAMKKNMRVVTLAMAILALELLILAVVGPLRIDRALSLCRFLNVDDKSVVNSPQAADFQEQSSLREQCRNGMIYVYDLPPKFNRDLVRSCHSLNPWRSMCSAVSNSGLGPRLSFPSGGFLHRFLNLFPSSYSTDEDDRHWPAKSAWYSTDQFSAEIIFHNRMLDYRCRTQEPENAAAFYIPFYAGLDISRYLWSSFSTNESSKARALDSLGEQLLHWLQQQPSFTQTGGNNHFFMAGRISWDFRRMPHAIHDWGSSLFHREQVKNITRLVIERSPWDESDIGVPYPTPFHPSSISELHQWLSFVRDSPRVNLFSFAGSPRPGYKDDFRQLLLGECRDAVDHGHRAVCTDCTAFSDGAAGCHRDPLKVTRLFLNSVFCLQPRGDSFTRKSIFDSLIAGCIPVFFWNQSAYWQYQLYLPGQAETYSVFIPHQSLRNGTRVVDVLSRIGEESVGRMQREVLKLVPGILYAWPSPASLSSRHWDDAFDIAVQGVLERLKSKSDLTVG